MYLGIKMFPLPESAKPTLIGIFDALNFCEPPKSPLIRGTWPNPTGVWWNRKTVVTQMFIVSLIRETLVLYVKERRR